MTERNPALWLQNRTDHTAEQERALITGLYLGKEGVMAQDDLKVVQRAAGANMSVDVGAGKATVVGDDNAAQGIYAVWNDAAKNVTISAADGTNPRRDIIVARVKDAFYSGASNAFSIEVITGTPAGSPADPSIPNNCLPLARVAVAAGASSITNANITDLRNRVGTMAACDIICTSSTRPTSPFQGMRIYETDTYKTLVYTTATTGWQLPWGEAWGSVADVSYGASNQVIAPSTFVDLTGVSVAANVVGNRWYEVMASGHAYQSTTGGVCAFQVATSVATTGTFGCRSDFFFAALTTQADVHILGKVKFAASGSVTFKVQGAALTGGGMTIYNNIGNFAMWIKDIGPAGNPV